MFLKKEPELAFSRGSGSLSLRISETILRMLLGLKSVMFFAAMKRSMEL